MKNIISILKSFSLLILLLFLPVYSTPVNAGTVIENTPVLKSFDRIDINNFGKIDNNYYRGAQPCKKGFEQLKKLGIKTVINLRHPYFFSKKSFSKEKAFVNSLGMNYINMPMLPYTPPADEQVKRFFKILNDKDNLPVFVFCKEGKDRTGIMTALYRVEHYNWDYDKAYTEMKSYGYHRFAYPQLKNFLYDYAKFRMGN